MLLLACLRGGGTSEEADEECYSRYIPSTSSEFKRRKLSDVLSTSYKSAMDASSLHTPAYDVSTPHTSSSTASPTHSSLNVSYPFMPSYTSSSIHSTHVPPNPTNCFTSPDAPKTSSPSETTVKRPDKGLETDQYDRAAERNNLAQWAAWQEHERELMERSACKKGRDESAQETTERRHRIPSQAKRPQASHPCYMTDDEFNALPCWSDVEDNPAYSVKYRRRTGSEVTTVLSGTDLERRASRSHSSSPMRFVPLSRNG